MRIFCIGAPLAYLENKIFKSNPSYKTFTDKELLKSLQAQQIRVFTNEKEAQAYAQSIRIVAKPPLTPVSDARIAPVFETFLSDNYALPEQQSEHIKYSVAEGMTERYNSETVNYFLLPRDDVIKFISSATFPYSNIPPYHFKVEEAKLEFNELQVKKHRCIIS